MSSRPPEKRHASDTQRIDYEGNPELALIMKQARESTRELEPAPPGLVDDEGRSTARECPQCLGVGGPCAYCDDTGCVTPGRWSAWHKLKDFSREPPR